VQAKKKPIEEEVDEVVEGWEGKLKQGMLQILWEQGFINPAKKKGRLHAPWQEGCFWKGCTIRKKSEAPDESSDGLHQRGNLAAVYHGRLLGVKVVWIPKCHLGIAGEGIKYDWGCGKAFNCCLPPLSAKKKTTNKFRESLKSRLDIDKVHTVERSYLFSK
jgi:hypothetical protein